MAVRFFNWKMIEEAIRQYKSAHGYARFAPSVVLFDMDGVLYDSMPNHAVAWQEAMKRFGIHFTAADSYATEPEALTPYAISCRNSRVKKSLWRKRSACMM